MMKFKTVFSKSFPMFYRNISIFFFFGFFLNTPLFSQLPTAQEIAGQMTWAYVEYSGSGKGAKPSQRVKWSHQLTKEEAQEYSLKNVMAGWNPDDH